MIMVDELKPYPHARDRIFRKGASHLTVDDSNLDALHSFAAGIGLIKRWFQPHPTHPHYDLTANRRERALRAGAVFVPAKDQARARLQGRKPVAPKLMWRCSNAECRDKEPVEYVEQGLGYVLGDWEPCVLCLDGCAHVVAEVPE